MNPEEKDPSTSYLTNYKTLEEKFSDYLRGYGSAMKPIDEQAMDLAKIAREHYAHFID